jgi:hypothetical protein
MRFLYSDVLRPPVPFGVESPAEVDGQENHEGCTRLTASLLVDALWSGGPDLDLGLGPSHRANSGAVAPTTRQHPARQRSEEPGEPSSGDSEPFMPEQTLRPSVRYQARNGSVQHRTHDIADVDAEPGK